jgi:hypothetical protein
MPTKILMEFAESILMKAIKSNIEVLFMHLNRCRHCLKKLTLLPDNIFPSYRMKIVCRGTDWPTL